jgi:hypothetical protein
MTLQPQASVQLTYADRPEIPETFADLLRHAMSEGVNVKLEFVVNRFEPAVAAYADRHRTPAGERRMHGARNAE